jgi:hypothetical protein
MDEAETDPARFGTLLKVPANSVDGWAHEALNFTPWLAENLTLLGHELGLALEIQKREHAVGRYSLDLLLEDSLGRVVIVENQFGQTDHDHLGKLLTYSAGTEADVVIWIAEAFTQEHMAALEWLNDSTVEEVGFFGVELEVLRIDNSRPAPHFRVVVRPNDWVKRVRPDSRPRVDWNWDAYAEQLRVPQQRIEIGQQLVELIQTIVEARGLPWQMVFRKGYVAFQRPGGYNVALVDIYWNRTPRIAIKIPAPPDELGFTDLYPDLESSWDSSQHEWGWTVPASDRIPDLGLAVDFVLPFHAESGPMALPARLS